MSDETDTNEESNMGREVIQVDATSGEVIDPPEKTDMQIDPASGMLVEAPISAIDRLIGIAIDKDMDIAKLKELMAMRKEMLEAVAKQAFHDAYARFHAKLTPIPRTKQAGDPKKYTWMYAPIDEIAKVVDPLLGPEGLSYSWDSFQDGGLTFAQFILTHRQGHSETAKFPTIIDDRENRSLSPQQKLASSDQYAMRRAMTMGLGITAADPDDDGSGGGRSEKPPARSSDSPAPRDTMLSESDLITINDKIVSAFPEKKDQHEARTKICDFYKVRSLKDVHRRRYAKIIEWVEKHRKAAPETEPQPPAPAFDLDGDPPDPGTTDSDFVNSLGENYE